MRNDTGEAKQGDLDPVPFKILGSVSLLAGLACAYIRNSPSAQVVQCIQQSLLSLVQRMIVGQIDRIHTGRLECVQRLRGSLEHILLVLCTHATGGDRGLQIHNGQIILLEHAVQRRVGIIIALLLKQLGYFTREDDITGKIELNRRPCSVPGQARNSLSAVVTCTAAVRRRGWRCLLRWRR
ncbi:hypothetical protein D3C81_1656430 [compost metagenome]